MTLNGTPSDELAQTRTVVPPRQHRFNMRMGTIHWRHLALQAERHGCTLSEYVRELVERDLQAQPAVKGDGIELPYRALLVGVEDGQLEAIGEARAA